MRRALLRSGDMNGRWKGAADDAMAGGFCPRPSRSRSRRCHLPDAERPDAARQDVLLGVRLQARRRCHVDRSAAAAPPPVQLHGLQRTVRPRFVSCSNRNEMAWVVTLYYVSREALPSS
jgi:hypothetical protein